MNFRLIIILFYFVASKRGVYGLNPPTHFLFFLIYINPEFEKNIGKKCYQHINL